MRRLFLLFACLTVWAGFWSLSADALDNPADQAEKTQKTEKAERPRPKRGPTFFVHASEASATNQLARAEALYREHRLRAAGKAYLALVYTWPDSDEAPKAQYGYARILELRSKYAKAFDEYQYLIDNYTGYVNHEAIVGQQFAIANVMMNGTARRGLFSGRPSSDQAIRMFEQIALNGPSAQHAAQAQFNVGVIRERKHDDDEAIRAYDLVETRFFDRELAVAAEYRKAGCLSRIAARYPNDEQSWESAREALAGFIQSHPDDERAPSARAELARATGYLAKLAYERARYYDRVLRKPTAAIVAYQDLVSRFPASEQAAPARTRMEELRKGVPPDELP